MMALEISALKQAEPIKLVIWDLDDTLWEGTLLEGDACEPREGVWDAVVGLDKRGVLQSIASRNDFQAATNRLESLGFAQYFVAPQIGWGPKSNSIREIVARLNIGMDAVLFIDDSEFELAEVTHSCTALRTLNAGDVVRLFDHPGLRQLAVTAESKRRRAMYMEEDIRQQTERAFSGPPAEFMASLNLELGLRAANQLDLERAEELIHRTNQLNSTGVAYSKDDFMRLLTDPAHAVLLGSLKDRFGDYGVIALVLLNFGPERWTLKLIVVSCRVMSRGIGAVLLNYLAARAEQDGKMLSVDFRDTGRNRPMRVALMMSGFTPLDVGAASIYRKAMPGGNLLPEYLSLNSDW
jgi:FkbH-like protein